MDADKATKKRAIEMANASSSGAWTETSIPEGRRFQLQQGRTHRALSTKAPTMNFVSPDTCLEDYKNRRRAFLKELIALTPNVSLRAKEFRRWIDKNSPYGDGEA